MAFIIFLSSFCFQLPTPYISSVETPKIASEGP